MENKSGKHNITYKTKAGFSLHADVRTVKVSPTPSVRCYWLCARLSEDIKVLFGPLSSFIVSEGLAILL